MLQSFLLGAVLAIATIAIHAIGTSAWISFLRKRKTDLKNYFGELKALTFTGVVFLVLHSIEVCIWAAAYLIFVGEDQIRHFEEAAYFSTVTFTSLGYGDVVITGPWRMLSAYQSMTGLLVFGWSTALLFAIVQRIWQNKFADENESPPKSK